jgi:hypothetical protein
VANTHGSFQIKSEVVNRAKPVMMGVAVLGWVGTIIAYFSHHDQFFSAYLFSYVYWISLSLGATFFVMVQRQTQAEWSVVVRRLAETVMTNFWILAVLFIPVLLGLHSLYEWTHAEVVVKDHLLQGKSGYLNQTFFVIRAVVFLGIWCLFSWKLYSFSVKQDANGDPNETRKAAKWSAPGIPILILSASFAAIDWLMSLQPHWYSTMWGVYFFAGGGVAFMALLALICVWLRSNGILDEVITVEHYHDIGKLLFAFNVFWAYIAFSQYFLIWYANLMEETSFFVNRKVGSWLGVSLLLAIGHFVVPFLILISRGAKRHPVVLPVMAAWMLFIHAVDHFWIVMPVRNPNGVAWGQIWMNLATWAALGGTCGFFFLTRLSKHSLVPTQDPFLHESLEFENA